MKILFITGLLLCGSAFAKSPNYFQKVTGTEALRDQHLNQYDDTTDPAQAFDITLPKGYYLLAADVDSAGISVCSVTSLNHKTQRLTIEALAIETDAGTCVVTLRVFNSKDKSELKVQYSIEQTGT